jgi:glutamate synthase (NADPH/NADH) small chain
MTAREQMNLRISEEVEGLMEKRGIGREDVEGAIDHGETTGEKFVNPSNGRYLTSHRPDRVTYWVEYSLAGDEYQVHRAYSHRMEMKRGGGAGHDG